jgi:hypothetical protein
LRIADWRIDEGRAVFNPQALSIRIPKSAIRNLSGRLPDGARLGTMAVALEGEIRNREAGVAGFKREAERSRIETSL